MSATAAARKSETLFQNLDSLIARRGLEHIGFSTLTFAENLRDRVEAQRRFNSFATGFLRQIEGLEWIAAVERQERGAIHYHLAAAFPWDIRSGFDFAAASAASVAKRRGDKVEQRRQESIYFRSANPALRAFWSDMRQAAPLYGFGRCETLPILSNSEGLARYVGAYVGRELVGRKPEDRGMRTIRYSLRERPWSGRWSFKSGGQESWRRGCKVLGAMLQTDDLTARLGKRWAFYWREEISAFGRHWEDCLAAVACIPEHYISSERLLRAGRMADAIFQWEEENKK